MHDSAAHLADGADIHVRIGADCAGDFDVVVVAVHLVRNCANIFVGTFAADGDGPRALGARRGFARH